MNGGRSATHKEKKKDAETARPTADSPRGEESWKKISDRKQKIKL
jgi:hypothetical protein